MVDPEQPVGYFVPLGVVGTAMVMGPGKDIITIEGQVIDSTPLGITVRDSDPKMAEKKLIICHYIPWSSLLLFTARFEE